ncbi:hypothetical protein [Klebsiella michiganensis]|uniref:hypothetical protein n=1 Tax=Klebsiella michiganensis TaxID=1134687 RepID=UPI0015E4E596|nr:hypothetical protein [Klebsiella michiganensis]QLP46837.1 hypothetical protein HV105_08780 [Klebsiella michiganensis]HDY7399538.1 hypothetical protein [Klebsiella pneumoniae]
MPISSIFIDGALQVIPGMKTLDDFIITNWFSDFPTVDGTKLGGYYFGTPVSNLAMNSFNNAAPATLNGSFDNSQGYINVDVNNYLDTTLKAPVALKVLAVIKRPANPSVATYFISDFSGTGTTGVGFGLGIATDGKLRMVGQNDATTAVASVDFPSSVAVGDLCAIAAHVIQGAVYVAIYNPVTATYVAGNASMSGTRVVGTKNILIGRKTDNNTSTASTAIKSAVLINGEITGAQQLAAMQYMLAMD